MITFEWPWMLLLLPLPYLVRRLTSPVSNSSEAALRVPFISEFKDDLGKVPELKSRRWLSILAFIAWVLLVLAIMRPQWLGEFIEFPVSGRDLIVAVDLSGSMQEEDFYLEDNE